ncbi:helix-turn-helix domain-containing protein [Planomonospora venezuelensis]|uniref:PucR C-terminal helix-turn-helix domain-containing protein n=1 Tax=Planomonospora venezuelensis TaxID=1999 RepID=A0A841D7R8_PLAVE|nr:helix-turn-helix domain-containing protein [Planomonospora venezuelensis]MBB5965980.1 hypothetical protein [Planomonospora venezuelensis]GIN01266.1 hypothetical protein Pve01_29240 [Planomonospora venezuelensis]
MQELLLHLSALDAGAENAVRVIAYFDSLMRDRASVPVLLQATARLARCRVGLTDAAAGKHLSVSPGGPVEHAAEHAAEHAGGPPPSAVLRPLGSGLGTVWMELPAPARGFEEIMLDRFAQAAEVALERASARARAGEDPALVELALSAGAGEAERSRALRLLGFGPAAPLRVLAVPDEDGGAALVAHLRAAGHHARSASMGGAAAVLAAPPGVGALPDGQRAGLGPAVPGGRAADSWAGARAALRFTGPHPADRVVDWAGLGALALFAEHVPDEAVAALPDVRALQGLARLPHGAEALEAVRALCAEGSVRRAAAAVHLHHSSLAARIARAETVLGFPLADPAGRLRAHLALRLLRLVSGVSAPSPGAAPPAARRRPAG